MTDYAAPTEGVTTPPTCEHGLLVGLADLRNARECQECDWCPACESVRRYDGETCTACGREWGSE